MPYPSCEKAPEASFRFECEQEDARWLATYPDIGPAFSCFRTQLNESIGKPRNRALLRAALADFLFHYKTSEQYPQDFIPWNRGASAQTLDNLFNPLIVEFNRDLHVYLETLQNRVTMARTRNHAVDYSSEGIVTVRVLSGTPAAVDVTTQSYFAGPPFFSTSEFLNALTGKSSKSASGSSTGSDTSGDGSGSDGQSSKKGSKGKGSSGGGGGDGGGQSSSGSNIPLLLSGNLSPIAAQSTLALMEAGALKTAQIGRDLSLDVTATTLSGASAAVLVVQLNSTESSPPSWLTQGKDSSVDNLNRVASHSTQTKVRVDSLKLFDISTFSATLTHGKSVPLIPPFIEFPYIGNLAQLRLPPGTVYHRSFAIVSAVIVPTAADIANSIEFRADLKASFLPPARWNPPAENASAQNTKKQAKSAALTTTVAVEQDGAAAPVDVHIGCCENKANCCGNSTATTTHAENKDGGTDVPKKPETKPVDYWIATRYSEGESIADPFRMTVSTATGAAPVVLSWEAPAVALSFDLYRGSPDQTASNPPANPPKVCKIVSGLHERVFHDDHAQDICASNQMVDLPAGSVAFSHLTQQPRNILEFHVTKLMYLQREADPSFPDPEGICGEGETPTQPQLKNIPVTE